MERRGRDSTGRLQSDITRRLDDFEKRGHLSAKMTEHYKISIVKARSNPIRFKVYLEQLHKDLDRIEKEQQGRTPQPDNAPSISPTSSAVSSGTSTSMSAFTEIASAVTSNASSGILNKDPISLVARHDLRKSTGSMTSSSQHSDKERPRWREQSKTSGQSELAKIFERRNIGSLEKTTDNPSSGVIEASSETLHDNAETVDYHSRNHRLDPENVPSSTRLRMVQDVRDFSSQVEEKLLEELFVEMCFFARLGYVQPPCCLRCTYREALKDSNSKSECTRWVIWRKDTNLLLHPNRLDGNLLIVQCHAARRLLAGKTLDGYSWSAEREQVFSDN